MRGRFIFSGVLAIVSLMSISCGPGAEGTHVLGAADWAGPKLVYVLPELECASCIERLKPFVDLMADEPGHPEQIALIISPDLTDRQGFADFLGLDARHAAHADFLPRGDADSSPPMMYLFSKKKQILFARPVTFVGHDLTYLKQEIMQLRHEFGQ